MSKWLNNKIILIGKDKDWKKFYKEIKKPCHYTGFCVYGQLVEEFPLTKKRQKYSCRVFGHNCPVFYHAEPMAEVKHKGKWVGYSPEEIR